MSPLPHSNPKSRNASTPQARPGRPSGRTSRSLTDDEVRDLRQRAAAGERDADLAARFDVSVATVGNIRRYGTRRDAGGPSTHRNGSRGGRRE